MELSWLRSPNWHPFPATSQCSDYKFGSQPWPRPFSLQVGIQTKSEKQQQLLYRTTHVGPGFVQVEQEWHPLTGLGSCACVHLYKFSPRPLLFPLLFHLAQVMEGVGGMLHRTGDRFWWVLMLVSGLSALSRPDPLPEMQTYCTSLTTLLPRYWCSHVRLHTISVLLLSSLPLSSSLLCLVYSVVSLFHLRSLCLCLFSDKYSIGRAILYVLLVVFGA